MGIRSRIAITVLATVAVSTAAQAQAVEVPAPPAPAPLTPAVLEAALSGIVIPAGWRRVPDAPLMWRNRDGGFVSAEPSSRPCLELGAPTYAHDQGYFAVPPSGTTAVALCLQCATGAVIVVPGYDGIGSDDPAQSAAEIEAMTAAIADRLRPPVMLPIVGVALRPRLAIEATADGFLLYGLKDPVRVSLRTAPGTCGTLPPGRADTLIEPASRLVGERWDLMPRRDARTVVYCLERRDDAVEVILDSPTWSETSPTWRDPVLLDELTALHDAIAATGPAPRWFGSGHVELELPRAGVRLRSVNQIEHAWSLWSAPGQRFKLLDGAGWGEPGSDVLVPSTRSRYALGVRRAACAVAQPQRSSLFPAGFGVVAADGPGDAQRVSACAVGSAGSFVVVARVVNDVAADNSDDVRAVTTSFARSIGRRVPGTPVRGALWSVISVPMVRFADQPSQWGVVGRGGIRVTKGRPFGMAAILDFAFGVGTDDFHPGDESHPGAKILETDGDVLLEGRLGLGGALSLGPVTLDAMGVLVGQALWPQGSWLGGSLGLSFYTSRGNVAVRYHRDLLEPVQSAEVNLVAPPIVLFAKVLEFGPMDSSLRPQRGLELGFGLMVP